MTARPLRLYLAGPEVFLPDAEAVGWAKKAICAAHGFVGIFPLDDGPDAGPGAAAIYARCLSKMRDCDAIVANLTPFRGIGTDPGTAFELGFMVAAGKPVFGYTNAPGMLIERTRAACAAGSLALSEGAVVEDFGLFDNLMLAEALCGTGGVVPPAGPVSDPERDLTAFRVCVARAADRYAGPSLTDS